MLRVWLKKIFLVFILALLMRGCVLETARNPDDVMAPSLQAGDITLVWKLSYGIRIPGSGAILWDWGNIHRGDIVVVSDVGDPPRSFIRRVAAIPGDLVLLPEVKGPTKLKEGEYFLEASEQNDKVIDSRQLGAISRRAIIGKVTHVWHPSTSQLRRVE